jgi:hypothetical protein
MNIYSATAGCGNSTDDPVTVIEKSQSLPEGNLLFIMTVY